MTPEDQYTFNNLVGGPLVEVPGHIPSIEVKGSTVVVRCSCGQRLQRATGCNRPGISYAILGGKDAYRRHIGGRP